MSGSWSRRPSLNALRTFEAAARLLSFTAAAGELHVSQAAVSRQVRQLEQALGKPLFERLHRRVELTPRGRILADELSRGLASIARAVDAAGGVRRRAIRVSVEPAFASRWLTPRLPRFLAAHAELDIEIESSDTLRELGRDADVAIRYLAARRRGPAGNAALLASVAAFPVLAPALLRGKAAPSHPRELLSFRLLHEDDGRLWRQWFAAAGFAEAAPRRHLGMSDQALVLQAAVQGQGVALGDDLLAAADLDAGRLLRPFATETPCGAYWLLWSRAARARPGQRAFCDWIRGEIAVRPGS
jgi:LysR family glycine cleavage system transcriptional activator